MKQVWIPIDRKVFVKFNHLSHKVVFAALLLLPIFLAACSGKLGKVEPQAVDTALMKAETAVASARAANAPSLAFEEFAQAEAELEKAKTALAEKNGNDAMRFAYQAFTQAKIAQRKAEQNTLNAEFNAKLLKKDEYVNELRKNLTEKETVYTVLEKEMQQLRANEKVLQETMHTLEKEKLELSDTRKTYGEKVAALNKIVESLQVQSERAEAELRTYGVEIKQLARKLEVAESMVKAESRQKRAAIAETESLKQQVRDKEREMQDQAKIYTAKLAEANKRSASAEHDKYLKKSAEEARAFVKSQQKYKPERTGRTSLSTAQITAGKAALGGWEKAWNAKNLNAHLAYYTTNATATKILTRESKENRSTLNRNQIESELRTMNAHPWRKIRTDSEAERESVIGRYRFSRLAAAAETEDETDLHHIWIREVWAHQVQGKWKIYREIWQIYENVPDF